MEKVTFTDARNGYEKLVPDFIRIIVEGPIEAKEWSGFADPQGIGRMEFCADAKTGQLTSFGGNVWPAAWPSLFVAEHRHTSGKYTYMTQKAFSILFALKEA